MKSDITLIFPRSTFLEVETMFPPLGIMYISSYLKHFGLNVQLLDMSLGHTIDQVESDIVGISFTTPQRDEAYRLLKELKDKGKIVVAGGPHPTHMSKECLDNGFDVVFTGYAEHDLLEYLTGEKYDRLSIDDLPYPDRGALPIKEYKQTIDGEHNSRESTVLLSARGCPFSCSFCSQVDPTYLQQSAKRTLDEIFYVRDKYHYSAFTIYDDTFVLNKKRFQKMHDCLSKEDFRFRCFSRSNTINDKVSKQLSEMGVVAVGLGVESGSNIILKSNMKNTTVEDNTRAIKSLQKYGIHAKAFIIVGLPGENHETVHETMLWAMKTRPNSLGVSMFQPLPGSDIFNNPDKYSIDFNYNGNMMAYRGKRGEYVSSSFNGKLTNKEIVGYHSMMEDLI